MKKKTTLKWFTLIEMIIVIVIVGILAVVLIESYITISKTALRVEQEKNLSEESLILTQVFQAISDEATINYDEYNGELEKTNWFSEVLHLTWWQWTGTKIYTTGSCLDLYGNFEVGEDGNVEQNIQDYTWCYLVMEQGNVLTPITAPGWKVVVSNVLFKIIPYNTDEHYFKDGWIITNDLHQPGFWMFIHLYAPFYQPIWTNNIDQTLQLFFNLKL